VLVFGVYDRDLSDQMQLRYPALYNDGRRGVWFKRGTFWRWMSEAYMHASIIFFVSMALFAGSNEAVNGPGAEGTWDLWCVGTATNVYVVIVALWRISAEVKLFTGIFAVACLLSLLSLFVTLPFFSSVYTNYTSGIYGQFSVVFERESFWLGLFLVLVLCGITVHGREAMRILFNPGLRDIVREMQVTKSTSDMALMTKQDFYSSKHMHRPLEEQIAGGVHLKANGGGSGVQMRVVAGSSPSISERVTEELAGSRSSGRTSKMSTMRINDEGEDTDELADARFAV
jgi:magnesium-transporting ATPase (P-type)